MKLTLLSGKGFEGDPLRGLSSKPKILDLRIPDNRNMLRDIPDFTKARSVPIQWQ
jgi:hypothetical protein